MTQSLVYTYHIFRLILVFVVLESISVSLNVFPCTRNLPGKLTYCRLFSLIDDILLFKLFTCCKGKWNRCRMNECHDWLGFKPRTFRIREVCVNWISNNKSVWKKFTGRKINICEKLYATILALFIYSYIFWNII